MKPRITIITLGMAKLPRAIRFYRDGLGFPTDASEDSEIAIFITGGVRLALYPKKALAKDTSKKVKLSARGFGGITLAHYLRLLIWMLSFLVIHQGSVMEAQQSSGPHVSIVWPTSPFPVDAQCIKLKADASSSNGTITNVEFLVNQNSIGAAAHPPFSLIWNGAITNQNGMASLTAVASDSAGNHATSAPVQVFPVLRSPYSIVAMTSPTNGAVFSTTDTIQLTAELLASAGCDTGPEEFFVGGNSVGIVNTNGLNEAFTIATPPFSVTVSNLAEGMYPLSVHLLDLDSQYCECGTVNIQVVKLALASPKFGAGGPLSVDIVTSFAGRQHTIESSTNSLNWSPVSTNLPVSSRFTFRDTSTPAGSVRFYRVSVSPQ